MNRKPMPQKPAMAPVEEEISEDLLANVPDLSDAKAGGFAGFVRAQPADAAVPFTVLADEDDDAPPAVDTLMSAAPGFQPPPDAPRPVPYPLGRAQDAPPPITPTPFPLGGAATPAPPAPPVPGLDAAALDLDVHGLVDQARTLMENAFQAELSRVETTYGRFLQQMESQLKQAELELAAVQAEHAKVKAETDKKAETLRDLKKALESI